MGFLKDTSEGDNVTKQEWNIYGKHSKSILTFLFLRTCVPPPHTHLFFLNNLHVKSPAVIFSPAAVESCFQHTTTLFVFQTLIYI